VLLVVFFSGCVAASSDDSAQVALPACEPLVFDPVAGWAEGELPAADLGGSIWPGAAIADVTGDGRPDVIAAFPIGVELIQNLGAGWTIELLQVDGVDAAQARSVAATDLDADGDVDLFLGGELGQPSRFLYNRGDGTFDSVPISGFAHRAWSAAFGDFTGDGRVDLFIATYDAEMSLDAILSGAGGSGQVLAVQGVDGSWSLLDGALPDATADALSLQGAPLDIDADGDLDVYLVDDFGPYLVPNVLLLNDGRGHFAAAEETGAELAIYAMGAGVGDADGDGRPDLFVSDVGSPHYLHTTADGVVDATEAAGAYVPPSPTNLTSWGVAMADLDQDGWDDVVVSYGGLGDGIDLDALANADPDWEEASDEASLMLHNAGGERFERLDSAFTDVARARGLVVGDLDMDGRPDIVTYGKKFVHLFTASGGCSPGVALTLRGPDGNTGAFGARVEATVAGRRTTHWLLPSTTAGQSALEVYVGTHGLPAEDVVITWPDGTTSDVSALEAGTRAVVRWD